jgi:hypothetical protein
MSEKRISGAMPESPESSASAFFTVCSWAAFAPSAFATLFAERLALSEAEELGDFEADAEFEEFEGLAIWERSSPVLLRERYSATQSAAPGMESFEPLLAAIRPRVVPPERNGSFSSLPSLPFGALVLDEELENPEEDLEASEESPGRGISMEIMTSSPEIF